MDTRKHFDKKNLCQRCLTGVDNDHDGNCAFCAKLTDEEAAKMRVSVLTFTIAEIGRKQDGRVPHRNGVAAR